MQRFEKGTKSLVTDAARMPSITSPENGTTATIPASMQRPAYRPITDKQLLEDPGRCSGFIHMEGSMMRPASMCLQADSVITVTQGHQRRQ